jgi:hypothetical protein
MNENYWDRLQGVVESMNLLKSLPVPSSDEAGQILNVELLESIEDNVQKMLHNIKESIGEKHYNEVLNSKTREK